MMDFFDIILEADKPKKKTTKIKAETTSDVTDYTKDEDTSVNTKDDTSTTDDVDGATDYTEETDDDGSGDDTDNATDYTEETEEVEVDENESSDDSTDDTSTTDDVVGATDYTEETGDDIGDSTDTSTDNTSTDSSSTEEDEGEKEKLRVLMDDFISLSNTIKSFINKLETMDKSNIFANKITAQIISNLNILRKHVFEYISFKFNKKAYVENLYIYNYFIEALKINVEMLKKIKVFTPNS